MRVEIKYETSKTKEIKIKVFIRDSMEEAERFFNWRYGHKILSIRDLDPEPIAEFYLRDIAPIDPMVAGENCGSFMADGSRMV
jgi:hypothetical protein